VTRPSQRGGPSVAPGEMRSTLYTMSDRDDLRKFITDLAVVPGRVVLSSGQEADWYIDLRRLTLHHAAAPVVGRVLLDLTADWDFDAVGGLTLGADPVATAMLHAAAYTDPDRRVGWDRRRLDAFVVRKSEKTHGLQRRIEGPDVAGRRVLVVDDTSTTGSSVLTPVDVLREVGAEVVGIAVIVDRGAGDAVRARGLPYRAAFTPADLGL
jgi:orotate phosphoribosyltransferase